MKAGGLALKNLIQPTISLEMPVPSQGHYGFHSFPVVNQFPQNYTPKTRLGAVRIQLITIMVRGSSSTSNIYSVTDVNNPGISDEKQGKKDRIVTTKTEHIRVHL
jgi:hypothetical protein